MPGRGTHNKEGGKAVSKNKVTPKKSKRGEALQKYNKKLDDVIKNKSTDKKVKNMKDVRELAKKEFAKIPASQKKGKGTALKLYNKEVDKVLKEKVGVKDRKALHALVKK
jgi:hypothetical protein